MDSLYLMKVVIIIVIVYALDVLCRVLGPWFETKEEFYNIYPTELIDPDYKNVNQDPFSHYENYLRVGDIKGINLNCNNITFKDLLQWVDEKDLYNYVFRFDPSININDPTHASRVLKLLMKNIPIKHPLNPILKKCFPYRVRIS